jgi:hypothetical protein
VIQNSLDRLLAGMARELRSAVAPAVTDPYAHSQALACAELLDNLAVRIEWRADELRDAIESVRAVLVDAIAIARDGDGETPLQQWRALLVAPVPAPAERDELAVAYREHLAAIASVESWISRGHAPADTDALRERVRSVTDSLMAKEFERFAAARARS